jgi:hypothetical protein
MGWLQDSWDKLRGKTAAKSSANKMLDYGNQYAKALGGAMDASTAGYEQMLGKFGSDPLQQYIDRVTGGVDQEALLAQAQSSPLYQAQLSQIGDMTQSAMDKSMATASATGGVRGGNMQQAFADLSQQEALAKQQALGQSYQDIYSQDMQNLGMLGNLGNMQSGLTMGQAENQANWLANIAGAKHAANVGAEQTYQQGRQAGMGNLFGAIGGIGQAAQGFLPMFNSKV